MVYLAPDNPADRLNHLYTIIKMMMADHQIREEERLFCYHLAKLLHFQQHVIPDLVTALEHNVQAGNDIMETQRLVSALLKFTDRR
jgi:flagellar biosynthesis regulator FlbT